MVKTAIGAKARILPPNRSVGNALLRSGLG